MNNVLKAHYFLVFFFNVSAYNICIHKCQIYNSLVLYSVQTNNKKKR